MRRPALALLLGCLLLVAGASALDGYQYYQTIDYAGCDQDTYQQDIIIHRTTGTAYTETSGGLEIWHIFIGPKCRPDYGDVRFTDRYGRELAYYLWPDYSSESARVAVRLEGATSDGVLAAHWGNPSAATTSDGDATFPWIDQFDGDKLDEMKWTLYPGASISVANGQATISAYGAYAQNTYLDAEKYILESRVVSVASKKVGYIGWEYPFGASHTRWAQYGRYSDGVGEVYIRKTGSSSSTRITFSWADNKCYRLALDNTAKKTYLWADNALVVDGASYSVNDVADPMGIVIGNPGFPDAGVVLDYILVRAYSAAPPAATTFSGEQETAGPPTTTFTASPTAGLAPLTVQFTDLSSGSPTSWLWDFGDGGTSTAQNPAHTYTAPGTHTITLTATNEYGSDYELKSDYITVYGPVTAAFTASPTSGTAPLTVQFTDTSTGGPTSWLWSFGDGGTSTAQNPQHTYTTEGAHTVTLTASHLYSSDTETKTSYITIAVLQPFPGLPLIPRDLTGNGLYTDINGNNRLDYNDLTVFFQHLAWAKANQPTECFDFNGNGWLDYNDVITLFTTITGEHP